MDVPWDIFWHVAGLPRQGRRARRQARRAEHADAARRDAHRYAARPQHRGPGRSSHSAGDELSQLSGICNVKVAITDYQTLPGGEDGSPPLLVGRPAQRGDLQHAQGRQARRALVLGAGPERCRPERLLLHRARRPRTRCSRTTSSNFFLNERNAYDNFVNFNGYVPPQNNLDADALIKRGLIPKTPRRARSSDPTSSRPTRSCSSSASRASASGTTPGRSSRPAEWARAGPGGSWPFRGSPGSRSSSSSPSTPSSASPSATRTRSPSRSRSGTRSTGTSATCSTCCSNFWHGGQFLTVSIRTIEFVAISIGLSLLVGYPVAYYTARHAGRWKGLVLLLLIVPFWINYLMRMLAWINLLAPNGWGTRMLHDVGIERLFLTLGPALGARRLARRPAIGRDHRVRLRLHPVPDPAARRRARPDRPAADRRGARPRSEPVQRVRARDAAALEGRASSPAACS